MIIYLISNMRHSLLLFFLFCSTLLLGQSTTFYLIRHAEKADDRTRNPHITTQGLQRAQKWCTILTPNAISAVYSTDYHRTIETAQPTADHIDTDIIIYNPSEWDIDALIKRHKGESVLIVGHSNTTPKLANTLINKDKYLEIEHHVYGHLYIITITDCTAHSQLLNIE